MDINLAAQNFVNMARSRWFKVSIEGDEVFIKKYVHNTISLDLAFSDTRRIFIHLLNGSEEEYKCHTPSSIFGYSALNSGDFAASKVIDNPDLLKAIKEHIGA